MNCEVSLTSCSVSALWYIFCFCFSHGRRSNRFILVLLLCNGLLIAEFISSLKVLDACAAPGNKTVHLAALIRGKGKIIACELNKERVKRLKETIRLSGASSILKLFIFQVPFHFISVYVFSDSQLLNFTAIYLLLCY